MLIINQWATDAVGYITDEIQLTTESVNNIPTQRLYINGECFAQSEDYDLMNKLNFKLHSFIDRSRRSTDTFDIGAEINMILGNV